MGPPLITVQEARACVLRAAPRLGSEQVEVAEALDRVLADDVHAAGDAPPFACSAMDGYAVVAGPPGRSLTVVGESRAGAPSDRVLATGEAIRISTGAALPAGADAVIRQEDTSEHGNTVMTQSEVKSDANVRHQGEDMRAGSRVLTAGSMLGAAELGAAVAAGMGRLNVSSRPRVAVLCTGDELRAPGQPLGAGEIHNSNAPMLAALARHCGASVTLIERLTDAAEPTRAGLIAALERSEVVVVSGGVSVGPHDHVKEAITELGVTELFWGVALQPGKPTWFGVRDDRLVFGLPGNPVSAVVTFTLFVRAALAALQGAAGSCELDRHAVLGAPVRRNPAREQALRVRLEHTGTTVLAVPNGPQGSHLVTSLLGADALALIPAGEGELPEGSVVTLQLLNSAR